MSDFIKSSLLDDFEIPVITHETIKEQLVKIGRTHNVQRKSGQKLTLPERLKQIETEIYKVLGRYKGFVKVITNAEELDAYIDKAIKVDYLAFDTETNNSLDPLTCKVMGLCLYIPNTRPVYVPLNHCLPGTDTLLENQVSEEDATKALKRLKEKNTKVIYHNGKFDIRVINNTLGFYMPIWWDTMLAAQLIDENEIAKLKTQYKQHINPTIGTYSIDKLFADIPYAWVNPEIFALYAAIDAYDTYKLQQYQQKLFEQKDMERLYKLFLDVEIPVTLIVSQMEDNGVGIDHTFVEKLNAKYHSNMDAALENLNNIMAEYEPLVRAYQTDGKLDNPLNYNSPPQLKILLYDIIKAKPIEDLGQSTDKATLKELNIPFTNALLEYRHYAKLISAFTEALPKLCSTKDGKIHASFNQMGKEENNVRTGRFSSTDPNLQQIPSKEKVMRLMFKASDGHVFVGGDFKAQEPRMLAHMCQDPILIQTFNEGRDPYATIMSKVRNLDYWDCMEFRQDGSLNPQGKEIRSVAKRLMLGIMYGMGAKLMASNLGITVEECKAILETFYQMFPNVKAFTEGNEQMARDLGYVEDYLGRRRHLPDINLPEIVVEADRKVAVNGDIFFEEVPNILNVYDEEISQEWLNEYNNTRGKNKKAKFKESAKNAGVRVIDNGAFISKTLTQCTNARIQGGAATLTKKAMVQIYNNKRLMELGFKLLIPVHDELLGECPKEHAEECEKLLVESMIAAGKPECSVSMGVDTYCVKNWYADEVSGSIRDAFKLLVGGNPKKNQEPISAEEAYKKLIGKYSELNPNVVKEMCDGTYDVLSGNL